MVLVAAFGGLGGLIVGLLSESNVISVETEILLDIIGIQIFTIAAFWVVLRRFHKKSSINPMVFLRPLGLTLFQGVYFLILTLGMIIVSSEIGNIINAIIPPADWYISLVEELITLPLGAALLTVAILPAVLEEFLYRGCFVLGLNPNVGRTKTLIASSLLFGLVHLNPWQFFPAVFIGYILGLLALRTGSIVLPIIAHFLNNALVVLLYHNENFLPIRGFHPSYTVSGDIQPILFTYTGVILLVGGYWMFHRIFPPTLITPRQEVFENLGKLEQAVEQQREN